MRKTKFKNGDRIGNLIVVDYNCPKYLLKCIICSKEYTKYSSRVEKSYCLDCNSKPNRKYRIGDILYDPNDSEKFVKIVNYTYEGREGKYTIECSCGNILIRHTYSMTKYNRCCKECSFKNIGSNKILPNQQACKNATFNIYKRNAKKRGLNFNISLIDFLEICKKDCHYCGMQPSNICNLKTKSNGDNKFIYSGIDRIDSSKDYTIENCVPCCIICNRSKSDLSIKDWEIWITTLYNKIHNCNY